MNKTRAKILIVDDDWELIDLIEEYLTMHAFTVYSVNSGQAMDEFLTNRNIDCLLLDVMMPGEDGLSIARRLSGQVDFPVIMISANGDDMDKILGLEIGADDYLTKPFNPRELLARIKAQLRRREQFLQLNQQQKQAKLLVEKIAFDDYLLNMKTGELFKSNKEIALTQTEFKLLAILLRKAEETLSRDELMDGLKGYDHNPFDRSIDISINRLRKKIEKDPAKPKLIRTVWGKGYAFVGLIKVVKHEI